MHFCGGGKGIHFNGVSSRLSVLLVRAVSACTHPNQQLIMMLFRSTEHIQCIKRLIHSSFKINPFVYIVFFIFVNNANILLTIAAVLGATSQHALKPLRLAAHRHGNNHVQRTILVVLLR